jgi:hypothetical protein
MFDDVFAANSDWVYYWFAVLGGFLFAVFLSVIVRSRATVLNIFRMGLAVFLFFSAPSFFNRLLVTPDTAWAVIIPFTIRWWLFIGMVMVISAIILRYRRRED